MILLKRMHPERIIPDETAAGIVAIHLVRYAFARPLVAAGDVLDAACGVGYGSAYLAAEARSVVGVDIGADAVAYASSRYGESAAFRQGDVEALDFADASFDAVCSFETIEHVEHPERAIEEFARVLRPDGVLVISTPNPRVTTRNPENPFHRIEWSAGDFEALLRRCFSDVELYGQHRRQTHAHRLAQRLDVLGLRRRLGVLRHGARLLGTAPMADLTLDDLVIERGALAGASEIVAVCRASRG